MSYMGMMYLRSGAGRNRVRMCLATAVVSGGNAVFYPTEDGASSGVPFFSVLNADSIVCWAASNTVQYQFGAPTVAADRKSVTVPVSQLSNVLLGIIQIATAANGTAVNMLAFGE